MSKTNFITAIALAAALLFSACNKTETDNTDVNNDQTQTEDTGATDDTGEVEVPDYTYDYETKTYTVYTADGLLAWNVAVQDTLELNCTLAADINLTDSTWTLVGNSSNPYTGTFEGGGYTITGLTFNQEGTDYVGLIGYLGSEGKVQNLTLDNVNITGSYYVGGVVGQNYGTVTNCSASGSVSGHRHVGGVMGANNGTVIACYHASGDVSGTNNVGGVMGINNSAVIACYHASGDVSGIYIGGVVGVNESGTVTACYASGSVTGSTYAGGVVGVNYDTVIACYWSNYDGYGIGATETGFGSATKVDDTVSWSEAVTGMNTAISTWNDENDGLCEWTYELTGDLPTLKKTN